VNFLKLNNAGVFSLLALMASSFGRGARAGLIRSQHYALPEVSDSFRRRVPGAGGPPGLARCLHSISMCDSIEKTSIAPAMRSIIHKRSASRARTSNHLSRVAGDCLQVLVDSPELMVSHVPEGWLSHDLEKVAVERRLETIGRSTGGSAIWVYGIEIRPSPHDLDELLVSEPTFGQSRFVRRQIAGVRVRN
jgi:hypothetical protein